MSRQLYSTPRVPRLVAGADAVALAEQKAAELREQVSALRDLSTSLAIKAA
jgi:hypothetical protein